jgi:hypothetical protein
MAALDYQDKLARFLENHDEPRAAATFPAPIHQAAAIITFLTPGLRFFHQGQLQGKKVRISMHLNRGPSESLDPAIADFYRALLGQLRDPCVRNGNWQLLHCRRAWDSNPTSDSFIAFSWTDSLPDSGERRLVIVNYSDHQSQCYAEIPWRGLDGRTVWLKDGMSNAMYDRPGSDLASKGLFLDLPAWGYHVFSIRVV